MLCKVEGVQSCFVQSVMCDMPTGLVRPWHGSALLLDCSVCQILDIDWFEVLV